MAPRKRQGKKDHGGASGKVKVPSQVQGSPKQSAVSPTGIVAFFILLITVSCAVYIYNFVDVSDVIGNIQRRFDVLQGGGQSQASSQEGAKHKDDIIKPSDSPGQSGSDFRVKEPQKRSADEAKMDEHVKETVKLKTEKQGEKTVESMQSETKQTVESERNEPQERQKPVEPKRSEASEKRTEPKQTEPSQSEKTAESKRNEQEQSRKLVEPKKTAESTPTESENDKPGEQERNGPVQSEKHADPKRTEPVQIEKTPEQRQSVETKANEKPSEDKTQQTKLHKQESTEKPVESKQTEPQESQRLVETRQSEPDPSGVPTESKRTEQEQEKKKTGTQSKQVEKPVESVQKKPPQEQKTVESERMEEKPGEKPKERDQNEKGVESKKAEHPKPTETTVEFKEKEKAEEIEIKRSDVTGKRRPAEQKPKQAEPNENQPRDTEMPVESKDRAKSESRPTDAETQETYSKANITNAQDFKFVKDLDRADGLVDQNKPEEAMKVYDKVLKLDPKSPRATYGKARALDTMSEIQRSNPLLEQCIEEYLKVIKIPEAPKELMIVAAKRCVNRQNFRGWSAKAVNTMKLLLERFPDEVELLNEYGVTNLLAGRIEDAREAFRKALRVDKENGFAKVHLGFIIQTQDRRPEKAVELLKEGIATNAPGVIDGRFFFHLGDALYRLGRHDEAYEVYDDGAAKGLFASRYQRSLYNVDRLAARPWWTYEQTGQAEALRTLEKKWKVIRDEGVAQLDPQTGSFIPEDENLSDTGEWKQFTLFQQGRKNEQNCRKTPKTCELVSKIKDAAGCRRGQVKFSVMQPGVHVWPHCGPTNCRVRAHLGLVIPPGPRIRVADEVRTWKEGEFIIFDDSFEHEVWHEGNKTRLVLIVDLWHPELTEQEKITLSAI